VDTTLSMIAGTVGLVWVPTTVYRRRYRCASAWELAGVWILNLWLELNHLVATAVRTLVPFDDEPPIGNQSPI
jgi:hypothetical protein